MSLCWFCRSCIYLRLILFVWQAFFQEKNRRCARWLTISIWTNLETLILLALKVSAPWFFTSVFIYVSRIFTKVDSCNLITYVLAGFLKDCIKVQKIHVRSWATPSSPWSRGCRPSSIGRATILSTPQRSCIHKGLYSGPKSLNRRRVYCIAGSCIGYIRLPQLQKQCIC